MNAEGEHGGETGPRLRMLGCMDSPEMARSCRQALDISRESASELGLSAVEAINRGYYVNSTGQKVDWSEAVSRARLLKQSIPPDVALQITRPPRHLPETRVLVCNETTLQASFRLVQDGHRTLALNFANGVRPGGGFLSGAKAQEEVLCRSSALYCTLVDDPMYEYHERRQRPDSSDWVIYSPDVPVFRTDSGRALDEPWNISFLTSAAPYAPEIGQPESANLLQKRIHRILAVASAYGYDTLVLGAWGCGAFANDPYRTALDFRKALEGDFAGHFADVVFAITDWSPERRFLRQFAYVFS